MIAFITIKSSLVPLIEGLCAHIKRHIHPRVILDSLSARSVSICFHYQMLTLGLRLDLLVSGGLVEDDHHARTLEDGVFCHLVAAIVHVIFMYRRRHTFYPCAPLHVCHVWRSAWLAGPKFGTSCIPSDVGDCMRLVIAVCPAYGGKTW